MTITDLHDEDVVSKQILTSDDRLALRFLRWLRQGHVLLAISLWVKFIWFDEQMNEPFFRIPIWVATTLTTVMLTCWLPWLRPPTRLRAAIILDLAVTLIIFADLLYFRFFSNLLSFGLLAQSGQVDDISSGILSLMRWSDAWLFVDVILLSIMSRIIGAERLMASAGPFRSRRTKELTAFAVLLSFAWMITTAASQSREGSFLDLAPQQATGLIGYHFYDAGRFLNDKWNSEPITTEQLAEVRARLAPSAPGQRLPNMPKRGTYAGANVLVIQVEALQGLVVDRELGGNEITPNLNRLIDESIYFSDAYHQTSAGHTADAEWAAACSQHPADSGAAFFKYAGNDLQCLPEILREAGYSTAVHHANAPSFWNRASIYPRLGWDEFYSARDFSGRRVGWGVEDSSFFEQTVRRLSETTTPFYDLAITLSSHFPFDDESLAGEMDDGPLEGTMIGRYLDNVHYADRALGEAVERLKDAQLWHDTIVVIYGDHDSGITDREQFADLLNGNPTDYEFAQLKQQIPLIIHLPDGAGAGSTVDQPVGQVDVSPLLAGLLGLDPAATRTFLGTDPAHARVRPVVLPNGGFVSHEHLLATSQGPCYDRRSGEEVGMEACDVNRAVAREDLEVSKLINEHDLAEQFAG